MAAKFDLKKCENTTFTITFALEIVNLEIWSDHKVGWIEPGPPLTGIKINYTLYYGQSFEVHIVIHEQVAKVQYGPESCWVRTWLYLERRWLTFAVRHAFPVRAADLKKFDIVINIIADSSFVGGGARSLPQVYFSPLEFMEKRYFGEILESLPDQKETVRRWIRDWIWSLLLDYIPPSILDGKFNAPSPAADIRHQDTIMYKIQEKFLNPLKEVVAVPPSPDPSKKSKQNEKKSFFLKLSGDTLLAGSGRIIPFEPVGERTSEMGEVIAIISSSNLPAQDDVPVVFINIERLFDVPIEEFKKLNITHLYTRWILGEEVRDSLLVDIGSVDTSMKTINVKFNDHHTLLLNPKNATEITAIFLDNYYNIQLRGVITPPETPPDAKLFGYHEQDRDFGTGPPDTIEPDQNDFLIAITEIDARNLARALNSFISGDYPLFPPHTKVEAPAREGACTNDINLARVQLTPKLIVPANMIIEAQMTLEASLGVVGCKPPKITSCYSRLFCIVSDPNSIMTILLRVRKVNDELADEKPNEMLTGFALDTGDVVILYVEGPRDGNILKIWDMTEEFYPKVKPVFSTSARYTTRIYPEFLKAIIPFIVLKLHAPLGLMLACPSVYARPALPIPARVAALKFGRLIQYRYRTLPPRCALPTAVELRSFRLELCAPPRTYPPPHLGHDKGYLDQHRGSTSSRHSSHCISNMGNQASNVVNWEKN